VNITESEAAVKALTDAGLRFVEHLFPTADHLTLATNDEFGQGAEWLGDHRVDRNPPHVTFVVDPTEDSAGAASVADHAYWVSGVSVRDPKKSPVGTFDARSAAFAVGDGKPTGVKQGAGTLNGGAHGPMPYVERSQDWEASPAIPAADRLDVVATNVAAASVDAARARLSCAPQLNVKSDGPLDLRIQCSNAVVAGARCTNSVVFRLPVVRGQHVVSVIVWHKGKRLEVVRGQNVRRVSVRRVSDQTFSVRVQLRTGGTGSKARTVSVGRRVAGC
jgi:hypothetical protein